MLTYAVPDDLADHMAEVPDDAVTLLKHASILVRHATRFDWYEVTPAGAPEDPWVIDAFRDATCVQAAEWSANEINPVAGAGGVKGGVESSSIAGGSVKFDMSHADHTRASVTTLSAMALMVLRSEGLATSTVTS